MEGPSTDPSASSSSFEEIEKTSPPERIPIPSSSEGGTGQPLRGRVSIVVTNPKEWRNQIDATLTDPIGSFERFKALVREGKDRGFLNEVQEPYGTVLHKLAKDRKLINHLIFYLEFEGVDFSIRDSSFGNTALLWAIANANNTAALEIIKRAPLDSLDVCRAKAPYNSPLHLAVAKGYINISKSKDLLDHSNLELVQTLLDRGANSNLPDQYQNTPLHLACLRCDVDMIKTLIDHGANPKRKGIYGLTAEELVQAEDHLIGETLTEATGGDHYMYVPKTQEAIAHALAVLKEGK